MFIPVNYRIRLKKNFPIVEIEAISPMNVIYWINKALELAERGEAAGGKLFPLDPKEEMRPYTVYFSLIFPNMEKAIEFAKSL